MEIEELREKILYVADSAIKYARDLNIPSAEAYVYSQLVTNVSDNNGKIDSRDGLVQGIGIRAAIGKQIGFASTTGFGDESIKSALKQAHEGAKVSPENPMFPGFVSETKMSKEGILDPEITTLNADKLGEYCDIMSSEIDKEDKRIVSIYVGANSAFSGYAIGTTEGCLASSLSTAFGGFTYAVVTESGDRKTGIDNVSGRKIKSTEGVGKEAVKRGLDGLGSKAFEGTEVLPIVWEPKQAAGFLTFQMLTCSSGTGFVEKSNPWKDNLNQQVASKELTIEDNATIPDQFTTQAIDSEGTPKGKTMFIENGILQSFLFDRMYGNAAGKKSTANAQRIGGIPFESIPSAGINKLIVKKIGKNLEAQIAEIDKGILVTDTPIGLFTSNPITGDYSMTSNNSFLIEKGEIANPLKSISIAGNFFEAFKNIQYIGSDREIADWPVDAPTMTFAKNTISS